MTGRQLGRFKITALEFGHFRLDGGAMFGVVPRTLWEKVHPADDKNRIEMVMRCMLVEVDERKILIDTGFGEGRTDKFKNMFNFQADDSPLEIAFREIELSESDITDVIITHLHFDHCGGSTRNKQTNPIPTFSNARYYIQEKQLEHARSRLERDKASYLREDFEPLIEAGVVKIVNGEWELLEGFDNIICNGHTPSMQLPRIRDAGETLVYAADLIPLAAQFNLPWIMAYDLYPVTTLKEKKRILAQAVDENWIFFLEHDPKYITAKPVKTEKGYSFRDDG